MHTYILHRYYTFAHIYHIHTTQTCTEHNTCTHHMHVHIYVTLAHRHTCICNTHAYLKMPVSRASQQGLKKVNLHGDVP